MLVGCLGCAVREDGSGWWLLAGGGRCVTGTCVCVVLGCFGTAAAGAGGDPTGAIDNDNSLAAAWITQALRCGALEPTPCRVRPKWSLPRSRDRPQALRHPDPIQIPEARHPREQIRTLAAGPCSTQIRRAQTRTPRSEAVGTRRVATICHDFLWSKCALWKTRKTTNSMSSLECAEHSSSDRHRPRIWLGQRAPLWAVQCYGGPGPLAPAAWVDVISGKPAWSLRKQVEVHADTSTSTTAPEWEFQGLGTPSRMARPCHYVPDIF
jgi:hypothetical protein